MRLPFPERIPLIPTFSFAVAFCVIQLYQKTNPLFALACFFFLLVSAIAFNVAGGFSRPSGAYVFFYATLTVIIGLIWKAVLGEPADSNLQNPLLTISVFLSGICMMLVAVYFSTRLRTKRALLGNMVTDANMQTATVGCLICGILFIFSGSFLSGGNGSVLSALSQLNRFFPMAIILGVINAIRRSGGKRSISLPVLLAAGFEFGIGLLGFSKEGIITPFFCWTIAAASQGYKVSRTQIVGGILAIVFIFRYLAPYAQYGRNYREAGSDTLEVSLSLLSNLGYVREQYLEGSADSPEEQMYSFYDTPQGFFDRLQEFTLDDALIEHTRQVWPIWVLSNHLQF